jgi:hypothetical protein
MMLTPRYDFRLDKVSAHITNVADVAYRKVSLALEHLQTHDTIMWLSPEVAVMGLESVARMLRYTSIVHMQECNMLMQVRN